MSLLSDLEVPEDHTLEENYFVLMESHLPYLRQSSNTTIQSVSPMYGLKYVGDFYGLLDYLAVDKKYRYLIMRMNGLTSSDAYDGKLLSILIPDSSEANAFLDMYTSIEN